MTTNSKNPIVIVDDDSDDRSLIKDAFLENNPDKNFVLLENADLLLEFLKTVPDSEFPSLILLDLNMPGKDGREALQEIKKDSKMHHIPVVVFSTSSLDKDRIISYELGANCFLTKPSSYQEMIYLTDAIVKLWGS
ncbi:MAG: response regulator [Chitinophagaceae bacterium]|nr:response regulator [Chitinophagaceae bacterium]